MKIRMLVDSTFNLLPDFVALNHIEVIPLNVIIDGVSYRDGVDISMNQVMTSFNNGAKVTTSQPSPSLFLSYFEKMKNDQVTDVLCMTLASTLSGTYQSAQLAKSEIEGIRIHIVDTLTTAIGAELLAEIAMQDINNGKSIDEVIEHIERIKPHSGILLNMENLTSLQKSGRINRIKASIGNLLRVKPIIEFFNGKVDINTKMRTDKHVAEWIVSHMQSALAGVQSKIYILSAYLRYSDRLQKVLDVVQLAFPDIEIRVRDGITPVIAVNLGYGGYGIAWCYE